LFRKKTPKQKLDSLVENKKALLKSTNGNLSTALSWGSDSSDEYDSDDENYEELKKLDRQIYTLKHNLPYPHGNGIIGYATALANAAEKLGTEWKHPVWVWTILNEYKKIFPHYLTNHLQWKKDMATSSTIMNRIQSELPATLVERDKYQWIDVIRSYFKSHNIEIADVAEDVVFRPRMHYDEITDRDDVNYYSITKEDLVEEEYDDMWEYLLMAGNDEEDSC
jgi:hypothetical protein